MKVYTYCSYRFSPVGFILGTFEADPENSSDGYVVPEVDTDKDSVVRNCFEDGLIQKVFGNIPETEEYFILLKKIECDYKNEDGMSIPKYGNFAFSTTDPAQYLNMLYNLDKMPPSELAAAMNAFLIPDSKAENVAIRIDIEPFSEFLRSITRPTPSENDKAPDYLTINAISSSEKVTNTLRERFSNFSISQGSNNQYFLKKKKEELPYRSGTAVQTASRRGSHSNSGTSVHSDPSSHLEVFGDMVTDAGEALIQGASDLIREVKTMAPPEVKEARKKVEDAAQKALNTLDDIFGTHHSGSSGQRGSKPPSKRGK